MNKNALGYLAGGMVIAITVGMGFAMVRSVRAESRVPDQCADVVRTASIAGTAMQLCLQDESCAPTFTDYRELVDTQLTARECVGPNPYARPLE